MHGIKSETTETCLIIYCQYYTNKWSKIFIFQWQLKNKNLTLTLHYVSVNNTVRATCSKPHPLKFLVLLEFAGLKQ
jgi:hypothetical protein